MAAGLARATLGSRVQVDSAGIAVSGQRASPEAIRIMHELFGIDIADHCPRAVAEFAESRFDAVVTLDSTIYAYLLAMYPQLKPVLVQWHIVDPYQESLDTYRQCAQALQEQVQTHLLRLLGVPAPAPPVPYTMPGDAAEGGPDPDSW
jgi:protein-tyrosine-phosphatase